MNIQLKQGVLEMCILSFIKTEQRSGYQIEKILTSQFRIPEGSIYPLLSSMTKASYLESVYIEESGAERKYYRITHSGEEILQKLIHQWQSLETRIDAFIKEAPDNE